MTPAVRLVAAGFGALVLLVVVALASRGGLGSGDGGSGGGPSSVLLDYGFSIFLVAYLLAVPIAIWVYFVQGRESRLKGRIEGQRRGGVLVPLLLFVLVAGLAATFLAQRHARGLRPVTQLPGLSGVQTQPRTGPAEPQEPRFRWSVVVVLGAIGIAGAAYLVLRRQRGLPSPVAELAAELGAALDDAIDDVRAETDPRRAVIKAYARMETILAAHGLPRREAEAPYEYLARALGRVVGSAAGVERLTDLYEEARFSRHEIHPGMREEAIAALEALRDELRSVA